MYGYVYIYIIYTRGEGGLWPPSPLVQVAGATLLSSEEVVFSEFSQCSVSVISIISYLYSQQHSPTIGAHTHTHTHKHTHSHTNTHTHTHILHKFQTIASDTQIFQCGRFISLVAISAFVLRG